MKIDDFAKYKRLVESRNLDEDPNHDSFILGEEIVYNWMKETGRLDEGILGSFWSWIKRNFSITARRIHALADDFEKELMEEGRAEYNKNANPKDLAAKYRAGTYNRLSRDIENRMEILAEDDPDYKELVRTLANKKNLSVKKALIRELSGKMDPEDFKEYFAPMQKEVDDEERIANQEYDKAVRKLSTEKGREFEKIKVYMDKKISDERSMFKPIGIETGEEKREFIKLMWAYINFLSEKNKSVMLDDKTVYKAAKDYTELVKEISKKIESTVGSHDGAVSIVKKITDKHLKQVAKPEMFDKLKPTILREVDKFVSNLKDDSGSEEPDITTDYTEDVIDSSDVADAVETATDDTGKTNPSNRDIENEILHEVKLMFSGSNIDRLTVKLNKKIDAFNALSDTDRKSLQKDYEYNLTDNNKLASVKREDTEDLVTSYVDLVGTVVPYYLKTEEEPKNVTNILQQFLFEIYALQKDPSKKLRSSEKDKLIRNVIERYPDDFKK